MDQGLFITFEGGDGSGKSTQIKLLNDYLISKGYDVVLTREPGGTPISEKIREIILDKNNTEMDPVTEAFLYASSRAQHVAEKIKPALDAGKIVICDRFVDSSLAYQGYGRNLGDMVWEINKYAVNGTMPDITFLFKVDPEVGMKRATARSEKDRLEQEKIEFHKRLYEGYLQIEKDFDRIVGIDAERDIEAIHADVIQAVDELLCR